jgi:ribose-phosphate pyrophosphokinase
LITTQGFAYKKIQFPCGEPHVRITDTSPNRLCSVTLDFERADEIVELLLVADALRRHGLRLRELVIPYVPFGRQDRVAAHGDCFSLKVFADLINGLRLDRVVVTDPHSDVTTALINNCEVIGQDQVFAPILAGFGYHWLVSPDAGAAKKIHKLSTPNTIGVIECSKRRNVRTGEIEGVVVHSEDIEHIDCVIVDDICDGGRTFVEIAKVLRQRRPGRIVLMVTHGFFTKGLSVFDGLIDEVYTRKGRVK